MNDTTFIESNIPACPYCGSENNALSGNGTPSHGDLAVCCYCLEFSVIEAVPHKAIRIRKARTREEREMIEKIDQFNPLNPLESEEKDS